MNNLVWVLGASDPEMECIEEILLEEDQNIHYAAIWRRGELVRTPPGAAYKATGTMTSRYGWPMNMDARVCLVECSIPMKPGAVLEKVFGHHRKNDPGFHEPPHRYWEGSSIGQVWRYLYGNNECVPEEFEYVAAADHCLRHAYAGMCPGIVPELLLRYRVSSKAAFRDCSRHKILQRIKKAKEILDNAPRVQIGDELVADVREMGTISELPEASALHKIPVLYRLTHRCKTKEGILTINPDTITAALEVWKGKMTWGNPKRGFAGAWI